MRRTPNNQANTDQADGVVHQYRRNSAGGLSDEANRETAKRLADCLDVDETQAIHRALHELAVRVLPQYEADDGPLTAAQVRQIKKLVPQGGKRSVRSSLFDAALE